MIRWFRSLFAWSCPLWYGAYSYWENSVTGDRMAVWEGGYSAVDHKWLLAARGRAWVRGPYVNYEVKGVQL
jgi:hypothetical protein